MASTISKRTNGFRRPIGLRSINEKLNRPSSRKPKDPVSFLLSRSCSEPFSRSLGDASNFDDYEEEPRKIGSFAEPRCAHRLFFQFELQRQRNSAKNSKNFKSRVTTNIPTSQCPPTYWILFFERFIRFFLFFLRTSRSASIVLLFFFSFNKFIHFN